MKIASASMNMAASHSRIERKEVSESLRLQPIIREAQAAAASAVSISDAARQAQTGAADTATAIEEGLEAAANDPMLTLIRAMLALLTGREVEVFDGQGIASPDAPEAAPAVEAPVTTPARASGAQTAFAYERHELRSESESTQFAANGVVKTSDGRTISFSLSLSMSRSYVEQTDISVRTAELRQKKDPLVLNFAGSAAQLTSRRFDFDIDADGSMDSINFVGAGSAFLAIDKNGDGRINDGSELFGTQSGDGFADLAAFDSDANGWIDENDAVYSKLLLWSKDGAGIDALRSLSPAEVGAIGLSRIATPFAIKDLDNALQGEVRTSGVFLHENGQAGSLQQIDLTV